MYGMGPPMNTMVDPRPLSVSIHTVQIRTIPMQLTDVSDLSCPGQARSLAGTR